MKFRMHQLVWWNNGFMNLQNFYSTIIRTVNARPVAWIVILWIPSIKNSIRIKIHSWPKLQQCHSFTINKHCKITCMRKITLYLRKTRCTQIASTFGIKWEGSEALQVKQEDNTKNLLWHWASRDAPSKAHFRKQIPGSAKPKSINARTALSSISRKRPIREPRHPKGTLFQAILYTKPS